MTKSLAWWVNRGVPIVFPYKTTDRKTLDEDDDSLEYDGLYWQWPKGGQYKDVRKTSRAHARPGWRCAEGCIGCDVVFYNGLTCLFIPQPWGSVSIGTQESWSDRFTKFKPTRITTHTFLTLQFPNWFYFPNFFGPKTAREVTAVPNFINFIKEVKKTPVQRSKGT
jgi:hypothetical protein